MPWPLRTKSLSDNFGRCSRNWLHFRPRSRWREVMPKKNSSVVDDGRRIPDALWGRIEPILPPTAPQPKGGRPWTPSRKCMDGIFYVLRTGCQWKALPRTFGAPSTVLDRFQLWRGADVFECMWTEGLREYDELKGLNWEWQAMDGAMTKAPLGG